jgi:epsilon-lactone hydrolase
VGSDRGEKTRRMSARLAAFNFVCRYLTKPLIGRSHSPRLARLAFATLARAVFANPPLTLVTDDPDCTGVWVSCQHRNAHSVLLYLHGGGYIVGHPQTHAAMLATLSRATGRRVFIPQYRRAPDHPAPAQFDDALAAWNMLISRGYRADNIIIGGDSAGGGSALALLSYLCRTNQQPAAGFMLSPWTDMTLSGASLQSNADSDVLFPPRRIAELRGMVLGNLDPQDARISPLFGDFPNCPPVFLQASDTEILRDDTLRMVDRLRSFAALVTLDLWPATPHVWPLFHGYFPEADQAIVRIADFINTYGQVRTMSPIPAPNLPDEN